jgi:site-specific DNA-methyltransferase (adenine-specific)
MDLMSTMPDNYIDLAIVDPPYGIGASNDSRFGKPFKDTTSKTGKIYFANNYKKSDWDNERPSAIYFHHLKRVSKNQVIWGGNYFIEFLKSTSCFIVWDKLNGGSNLADCELAWTSFNTSVRKIELLWNGFQRCEKTDRIHPTQKPVALYRWLLQNYAKPGQLILDTHSGSGSCAIACLLEGFDFIAIEKDKDYWQASVDRFNTEKSQLKLF